MTEMIERVARAIFDSNRPDICEQHRNDIWVNPRAENVREVARDLARAAIVAMREPTGAMQADGRDALEPYVSVLKQPVSDQWQLARDTYRAMIAAALTA